MQQPQTSSNAFVPPPLAEKKTFGMGLGMGMGMGMGMGKKPEEKKPE